MDRSFLSQAVVVEASRDFVCARLATYEDADEATFLAGMFRGRSGQLENTVFTILAPDGKTKLTGAGRSPDMVFGRERGGPGGPGGRRGPPGEGRPEEGGSPVERMVSTMQEIAERYPAKAAATKEPGAMPYAEDVRLGLNIAACDMLPVAIVVAPEGEARDRVENELRPVAWNDDCIGRVIYAAADDRSALSEIEGVSDDAVLVVVQPDAFGLKGTVLAQTSKSDRTSLEKALAAAIEKHDPGEKDAKEHIRAGRQQGVDWETEVPVSDPHGPERRPPR